MEEKSSFKDLIKLKKLYENASYAEYTCLLDPFIPRIIYNYEVWSYQLM